MSHDDSRIEVGGGKFPVVPAAVAVLLLGLLVLGVAYAGRTPRGAEIEPAPDLQIAVNDHLAANQKRFPERRTYFNCAEFLDSIMSGKQQAAVAVEMGPWRPGTVPDGSKGNLLIVTGDKDKDGEWQIASKPVPGGTFDPSPIDADDPNHPCNVGAN